MIYDTVSSVAGSGKSSDFYADIEVVMDAKSIDQNNYYNIFVTIA